MAHEWNTCHQSKTPSESKSLAVALESEENFHHIEQLTGEDNLSNMVVSEEIPTSHLNFLSSEGDASCSGHEPPGQEADSRQDTGHEPPGQEADSQQDMCHEPPGQEADSQQDTGHEPPGQEADSQQDTGHEPPGQEADSQQDTCHESPGQEADSQQNTCDEPIGQEADSQQDTCHVPPGKEADSQQDTCHEPPGQEADSQQDTCHEPRRQEADSQQDTCHEPRRQEADSQQDTCHESPGQEADSQQDTCHEPLAQEGDSQQKACHEPPQQEADFQKNTGHEPPGQKTDFHQNTCHEPPGQEADSQQKTCHEPPGQEADSQQNACHEPPGQEADSQQNACHEPPGQEADFQQNTCHEPPGQEADSQQNTCHEPPGQEADSQQKTCHERLGQEADSQQNACHEPPGQEADFQQNTCHERLGQEADSLQIICHEPHGQEADSQQNACHEPPGQKADSQQNACHEPPGQEADSPQNACHEPPGQEADSPQNACHEPPGQEADSPQNACHEPPGQEADSQQNACHEPPGQEADSPQIACHEPPGQEADSQQNACHKPPGQEAGFQENSCHEPPGQEADSQQNTCHEPPGQEADSQQNACHEPLWQEADSQHNACHEPPGQEADSQQNACPELPEQEASFQQNVCHESPEQEADSQQGACCKPSVQKEGKSLEAEADQSGDLKATPAAITTNDRSCLNSYSARLNPGLLLSLDAYSDVSSCSDADLDCISNVVEGNTDPSSESKKVRSPDQTCELDQGPSSLFLTADLHGELAASDNKALENKASDTKGLQKKDESDLNDLIDEDSTGDKSCVNQQALSMINSSTVCENESTLKKGEEIEKSLCLTQNSESVEEPNMDCNDFPNTEISSELNSVKLDVEGKRNDLNGQDAYPQSDYQLEGVRPTSKYELVFQENESNHKHEKTLLDPEPQHDTIEGKCSINQVVERSSFEFLQSCLGLKHAEHNPPILNQHEKNTSTCKAVNEISNCDVTNVQPPTLMRAAFEMEEAADFRREPPILSAFTQLNDCIKEQKFQGSETDENRTADRIMKVSLVPAQKLMKKLQPVVLLTTTERKADGTQYYCSECTKNLESLDKLIEHYHCEHSLYDFQYCVSCGYYLSGGALAEQHVCKQVEPNSMYLHDSLAKQTMTGKYRCRYCLKPFIIKACYHNHEERHVVVTKYRCGTCGLYFLEERKHKSHVKKTRCLPLKFEPTEVDLKRAEKQSGKSDFHDCFVKLVDISSSPQNIVCPVCGKIFKLRAQLKSHLRSHSDERAFKCATCNKAFKHPSNLNKHKKKNCSLNTEKIHGSPKLVSRLSKGFSCPICERVFKYSYNRSRHLREQCLQEYTRQGKGKVANGYKCPLCSETFSMSCNRNRHLKHVCFQRFKVKWILNKKKESKEIKEQVKEERAKLLETPLSQNGSRYKCKLCPAMFAHKSGVYRHMKSHKSIMPKPSAPKQTNTDNQELQGQESLDLTSSQDLCCRFCERTFCSDHALNKHLRLHGGKKPFRCLDCGKNFGRHGHLLAHKNVHRRKIQCSVCKKILPTIGDLLKHRQSHIKKGMLKCPDCPMEFKFPVFLLRHVTTHENKEPKPKSSRSPSEHNFEDEKVELIQENFFCGVCKKDFVDSKALSKHCLIHMPKSSVSRCQFCRRDFQSRAILIRHIRLHTGEKPFSCDNCGKHFSRKEYVRIHKEKCSSLKESLSSLANLPQTPQKSKETTVLKDVRKMFTCSYCPHVFTLLSSVTIHERAHKRKTIFPCPKCGKYYRKKYMKEHQKNCKVKESQHACQYCGATFSKTKTKNAHERMCQGSNSVVPKRKCSVSKETGTKMKDLFKERCPHCSKSFRYRSYLLRHISSHLRKKLFPCLHCGQKYNSQKQFLRHEAQCVGMVKEHETKAIHDSSKTKAMSVDAANRMDIRITVGQNNGELKCSFCTKTFTKPRNLRRHILTHTDVKPYRCKTCENSFSRYDRLKLHQAHCKGKKPRLEVRVKKINVDVSCTGFPSKMQQPNDVLVCGTCSKQFTSKSNLSRHISMLHNAFKPYSCPRCDKTYSSKRTLKTHMRTINCTRSTVPSLKPPQSNAPIQPGRETQSKLLQRIQGHYTNKFKFQCGYCPRRFKNHAQLNMHIRLHTGEKPFGCASCGERFIRRDYLQRHLIKCSGRRETLEKVSCDQCGGLFTKAVIRKHQKNCLEARNSSQVTNLSSPSKVRGFSCVRCKDRFLLFSQLQQHFITKHRSDGLQQSDNLQYQPFSSTYSPNKEPVSEANLESLPSSSQVRGQEKTHGEKEKPFQCHQCKLKFITRSGLLMHVRSHTAEYPLTCNRCSKGFWNKSLLLKHKRKCRSHMVDSLNSESAALSDLELNDTVLVFNKGSNTTGTGVLQAKFSCKDQEKGDGINKYQCSECDQSFTDGLRLISHLEDHGREDLERRLGKKHQCHLCSKTFDHASVLQRHMKTHNQETASNTCSKCFRSFRYSSDLEIHMSCHDPNRPFECDLCKLRFWTSKASRIHRAHAHSVSELYKTTESSTAGTPKIFICHPCNKTYTSKKSYRRHCKVKHHVGLKSPEPTNVPMQQHTDTNEPDANYADNEDASDNDSDSAPYFPCHVCGKTFVTCESLEDHQRCHLGEKPHECAECGKCFFQLINLQLHLRTHKTEFQCQMCGKGFVSLLALRKHKHSHVTKRPHRCSKCHLSFTGSSQLAEHMISHRDENFPCDLCSATFSCKSSRAEHRKIHAEQEEELPPLIPPLKQTTPPPLSFNSPSLNSQQYTYRCGICQVRFQDAEQLSEHGCNSANERPYSCPDCNKYFLHGAHLKKHQLSHQLSGPHSFQCKSCPMSFNQRHHLLTHSRLHGGEELSDSQVYEKGTLSNTNSVNRDKIYKCPICPESFAQALELASHLSVHSYMCNVCTKTFATKQQLEEHEQSHLSTATQYECTECGDSFLGSDAFRQHNCARQKRSFSDTHLGHASKSPPRKKRSSGASFKVISNEEEEEDVDVGEDFYNCPVCNKRFTSCTSLQEHQKLHEDGRPFKCLVCGKGFAKKKYLTQHQQLHSERPYQCEFCSEAFKTETSFLSHRKMHDASRKHQCSVCNKAYRTTSELLKHAKKHEELRNSPAGVGVHRCDMCYQSFTLLSQLQKHQETHVGQIVYECTECDKAFAFPNLLEEHQQIHAAATDFLQPQSTSHILFQSPIDE